MKKIILMKRKAKDYQLTFSKLIQIFEVIGDRFFFF